MDPDDNRCRGCGEKTPYVYCDKCAKDAKCPHGEKLGECNDCDVLADLAYDANRGG